MPLSARHSISVKRNLENGSAVKSAPTIKNWETGQSMPNEQYLKAIAELGHVSMEELTETGR
ncbi:MAG: helix-turn-helix domain-containing protein [Limosilactobacillus pontis]